VSGPHSAALAAIFVLGSLALAGESAADETIPAPNDAVTVGTFAGTGVSGNRDGSLAVATFASPSGLATGSHGANYVVDKALNTLREIEGGTIRTLVGIETGDPVWRASADRDGPAASAAFNHPEGIAVAPDGSVVVADTLDAAVRRYKDGAVTTVAGAPGRFGSQDGPVATASFKFPVGVAVDASGDIFVADQQNGVREISKDGIVTTLPIANAANVTSVALGDGPAPELYVASEDGLVRWNVAKATQDLRYPISPSLGDIGLWPESHAPLGHPYGLAADGRFGLAYTDVSTNSVYRLDDFYARGLAGGDPFDPNWSGGYVDGRGPLARFFAPLGITKVPSGWLVADAGNHRLRLVSNVDDRRSALSGGNHLESYYSGERPAVVLIGNSQVWYDTDYRTSIAGQLHGLRPGFDIVPVALIGVDDPGPVADFCSSILAPLGKVATIVYVFNDLGVTKHMTVGYGVLRADPQWPAALTAQFVAARAQLGSAFARTVVVDMPSNDESSPNEQTLAQQVFFTTAAAQYGNITDLHRRIKAAIVASGFDYVDAWPAFRAADAEGAGPLFGPFDYHLAPKGRLLLAQVIDRALRARHE
jgi:hypothetical protein